MKIRKLAVQNYKSLRDIGIELSNFTVIIGANGSGKSNLASAFDFLGDVYQFGLEFAIAKKGGYENVAYRKIRRTKSSISFKVLAELSKTESKRLSRHAIFREAQAYFDNNQILIEHHFAISTDKQSIRSDYSVDFERIKISTGPSPDTKNIQLIAEEIVDLFEIVRIGNEISTSSQHEELRKRAHDYISYFGEFGWQESQYDLVIRRLFGTLATVLGASAVHSFSPQISRAPGSPSPQPRLTGYGQNLPSLVDWLQRHHQKKWRTVESAMHDIIPDLEEITIEYLHTKQLGLFFKEKGFGRAWTAEDVSDGTIQTLAILSAIADPRNSVIFLEEPENSVHPWIVRQIANQLKKLSPSTQIIVTTHSPLILNVVNPQSVWICYKQDAQTKVESLETLGPEVIEDWENGVDRLFDLLDTGMVLEATPGAKS